MIYLDYAANHPVDAAVLDVFCRAERELFGNPNADHPAGQAARAALAQATEEIAALLGVPPAAVVYTSGATEANNLAVKGLAHAARGQGRHILTTELEHASVRESLAALQSEGFAVETLPVRADGTLDPAVLAAHLRPDTVLLAVCAVDSELGCVQPLGDLRAELKKFPNCRLHLDAVQAVGHVPVDFAATDTVSLALHKVGGLNGSGLLLHAPRVPLAPLLHGGHSASDLRPGTPTAALALAAAAALRAALGEAAPRTARVRALNDRLRTALAAYPQVRLNSPANAAPHILNLGVRGVMGSQFQRALAAQGICVSVQSACASAGAPSAAVLAVTGDRRRALESWRISLSHLTTDADLDAFLQAFDRCLQELAS